MTHAGSIRRLNGIRHPRTLRSGPARVSPAPSRTAAFTLIELLFVCGILVLLVALLLPAVTQSRKQARLAVCTNNLHQIHVASQVWKTKFDPQPLSATGWRTAYAPLLEDLRVYNCAESVLALSGVEESRAGDKVSTDASATTSGGTSGGTTATPPTDGSSPSNPTADLKDVYVRTTDLDGKYATKTLILKEGPWVKKRNDTGSSYELWYEHQYIKNGSDEWDDLAIRFTTNGDGSVTMELIPRKDENHHNFRTDVWAVGPDGQPKEVFPNAYGVDKKMAAKSLPGKSTILSDATDAFYEPSPGSAGSGTATGGTAGTNTATAGRPGYGTASDYGMNFNVQRVDGFGDRIFAMDYTFSIVRPTVEDWAVVDTKKTAGFLPFARHFGYANVAYADGSVRPERVSKTTLNPAFGLNQGALWDRK